MSESTKATPLSPYFRRVAGVLAGGALVATGMVGTSLMTNQSSAEAAGGWDGVAQCESGGNWSTNTGNGFKGGLQFTQSTWEAYGGTQYASSADKASKSQQIAVGEKVLAGQGAGAWPNCGKSLTGGADTSGAPSGNSGNSSSDQGKSTGNNSGTKKSNAKQGDWSCDGDGIPNNCDANGNTIKKAQPKKQSNTNTSGTKKSQAKQGDWSCDGDGIPNNCDANGNTIKKSNSHRADGPAKTSKKSSGSNTHAATGVPSVSGSVSVDGKLGSDTVSSLQDWLDIDQTGKMDTQTVKAVQAWVGTEQDGKVGPKTVAGIEHEVGANQTGSSDLGGGNVKTLQSFLNLY
jgi:hypothetical protein